MYHPSLSLSGYFESHLWVSFRPSFSLQIPAYYNLNDIFWIIQRNLAATYR